MIVGIVAGSGRYGNLYFRFGKCVTMRVLRKGIDFVLSWLTKWLVMVPWNIGTIIVWYHSRWEKTHRSALRAVWDINRHAKKAVVIRSLPDGYDPNIDAHVEPLPFGYVIRVRYWLELGPHFIVHEALHIILRNERFPLPYLPSNTLTPNVRRRLLSSFRNVLHHPEIYRRMEQAYHLPMPAFWEHQREQSLVVLNAFSQSNPEEGARMSWIMTFFFWDFVPAAEAQKVLDAFHIAFPVERQACRHIRLLADQQGANIHTVAGMAQVAAIVRDVCLDYCDAHPMIHPSYREALPQMTFIPDDEIPPEPD